MVSLGRRGPRKGRPGGQADLFVDRLCVLPLVSCDGPRELRGPGDRGRPGPLVRLGQSGPGGAPGPRLALHGGHPIADRIGRLAHVRVLHARRPAVLRRYLLPTRGSPRDALVPSGRRGTRHRLGNRAGDGAGPSGRAGRRRPSRGAPGRIDDRVHDRVRPRSRRRPRASTPTGSSISSSPGWRRGSTPSGAASDPPRNSPVPPWSNCACGITATRARNGPVRWH